EDGIRDFHVTGVQTCALPICLMFRDMALHLLQAVDDEEALLQSVRFLAGAEHFFLHVTMAAAKATLEPANGIPYSTIVTTMARRSEERRVGKECSRW